MAKQRNAFFIITDFGLFIPSRFVSEKLDRLPKTKRGRFDRRYKASKVAQRYVDAVLESTTRQWEEGADPPFYPTATNERLFMARAKLAGYV
jgi:hypothetical protein